MSKTLPNIDDLFKKALENSEEEPSKLVWENIDRKLDKKGFARINVRYRRLRWVAAASIIMTAALGMVAIYHKIYDENNGTQNLQSTTMESRPVFPKTNPEKLVESNTKDEVTNGDVKEPITTSIPLKDLNNNQINQPINDSVDIAITTKDVQTTDDKLTGNLGEFPASKFAEKAGNKETADKNLEVETPFSKNNAYEKSGISTSGNTLAKSEIANSEKVVLTYEPTVFGQKSIDKITSAHIPTTIRKTVTPILALENHQTTLLNASTAKKLNRWSATLFASADFVTPTVKKDKPQFRDEEINAIKQRENTKTSSTYGVLANYYLGKGWSIMTGLTTISRVSKIESKTIFARHDPRGNINYKFSCAAGYTYLSVKSSANTAPRLGDSLKSVSALSRLQYLGVPIALKYHLNFKKFSIDPLVGVTANFLLKGDVETSLSTASGIERTKNTSIQGLKKGYTSALLGMQASYKINNRFAVTLIPMSRIGLSSINENTPAKTYLNSFNLAAGITTSL